MVAELRTDGKCIPGGESLRVRRGTIEEIAARLSRRLGVALLRVTGDPGMSGWWTGYRPVKTGGLTSTDIVVHIVVETAH